MIGIPSSSLGTTGLEDGRFRQSRDGSLPPSPLPAAGEPVLPAQPRVRLAQAVALPPGRLDRRGVLGLGPLPLKELNDCSLPLQVATLIAGIRWSACRGSRPWYCSKGRRSALPDAADSQLRSKTQPERPDVGKNLGSKSEKRHKQVDAENHKSMGPHAHGGYNRDEPARRLSPKERRTLALARRYIRSKGGIG